MAIPSSGPAAGYKFNSFEEIKSHSSILFNERVAILFYLLDMRSIELNTYFNVPEMLEVRAILKQIYKNIRTLLRNNPVVRATLNLETKDPGIYVTDMAMSIIDKMIEYCEVNGYTMKKIYVIVQELNKLEMLLHDVLQYFHYFIRPEFRQKPDIEIATETYKEIADQKTVDELRALVGKNNKIDFEGLGTSRVDLVQELDYDPTLDGEKEDTEPDSVVDEEKEVQ